MDRDRADGRPEDRRREDRSDRPDGRRLDDRYDDRRRDYDRRDRDYDRRDRDYDRRDRGYDRRDRGRDDRYDDRHDDRHDERRRERSPEREAPRKKRGWDDMGTDPANAQLLLMQQQAFAMTQSGSGAAMPGSKKQRELYVGNLPPEATEVELSTLFTQLLSACEGYNPILGPPCPNASIAGGHTFAFVEFRDEQLCGAPCETAMQFNGITLHGRALKIGHPNGYVPPMMTAQTLKVPAELMEKLGLAPGGALPPGASDNKRQRELYVGNLTVGAVTAQMIKELFAVPLATIPGHDPAIPPVREARCDPSGKFAFVEFSTEALAATALQLFNGMELCGRDMKLARPSGYVAPAEPIQPFTAVAAAPPRPLAPLAPLGGGAQLAPLGGGAPPPPPAGAMAPEATSKPTPTHVLCLRNLLSAEILADATELAECVADIREECESFGKLAAFVVPTEAQPHGHSAADFGACFVKYEAILSAGKAQLALDGRDFDGHAVSATFLPDDSMWSMEW